MKWYMLNCSIICLDNGHSMVVVRITELNIVLVEYKGSIQYKLMAMGTRTMHKCNWLNTKLNHLTSLSHAVALLVILY